MMNIKLKHQAILAVSFGRCCLAPRFSSWKWKQAHQRPKGFQTPQCYNYCIYKSLQNSVMSSLFFRYVEDRDEKPEFIQWLCWITQSGLVTQVFVPPKLPNHWVKAMWQKRPANSLGAWNPCICLFSVCDVDKVFEILCQVSVVCQDWTSKSL